MEFYVEGLRSRTLKSLTPKLGKLPFVSVCDSPSEFFFLFWSTFYTLYLE